jgi:peptide/nickel transport system permease protein
LHPLAFWAWASSRPADWGGMVRENAAAITFGIFSPCGRPAIAFLTVGVNLIVDWFLHVASGLKDV